MIKLLKNARVYAPRPLGRRDILVAGGGIAAMAEDLSAYSALPHVEVIDLKGALTVPGLIDLHIHITGGGGELGPASRVPELALSQLTTRGITTVLGLLGTDGVTRSPEALLTKCQALRAEGISCYCLTGSYQYPPPTVAGGVARDVILLEPVVGVKLALSDHRGSNPTLAELIRLGSDARLGGLLSGKAGIVVIHMGDGKAAMEPIFEALEASDIPMTTFVPTHCGRNDTLVGQAARYTRMGGAADFTASAETEGGGAAAKLVAALELGADPDGLTLSTDSGGSLPRFDATGACTGMGVGTPEGLLLELARLVEDFAIPLETALAFVTRNPARVLGMAGKKGVLAAGADADILVLGEDYTVDLLLAQGAVMVRDGAPTVRGMFEG